MLGSFDLEFDLGFVAKVKSNLILFSRILVFEDMVAFASELVLGVLLIVIVEVDSFFVGVFESESFGTSDCVLWRSWWYLMQVWMNSSSSWCGSMEKVPSKEML